MKQGRRQLLRFLLAGAANTLTGYLVFAVLLHGGIAPVESNIGSYAVGLVQSYLLNRYFVFQGSASTVRAVPLFLGCFGIAYGLNLLVLLGVSRVLGAPVLLAQALAMITYTAVSFLLNRTLVFRQRGPLVESGPPL